MTVAPATPLLGLTEVIFGAAITVPVAVLEAVFMGVLAMLVIALPAVIEKVLPIANEIPLIYTLFPLNSDQAVVKETGLQFEVKV